MASAQVSSRKQEHLEAGKRRLEEFRKQKAAGRLKKAASAGQPPVSDSVSNDEQLLNGKAHPFDSKGAGTSGRISNSTSQSSIIVATDAENLHSKTSENVVESQIRTHADPLVPKSQNSFSFDLPPTGPKQEEHQITKVSGSLYPINNEFGPHKEEKIGDYGAISRERRSWDMASSDQSNDYGHFRDKDALSDKNDSSKEIPRVKNSYAYGVDFVSSQTYGSTLSQSNSDFIQPTVSSLQYSSEFGQSGHGNSDFNKHLASEWRERKPVYDNLPSLHGVATEESHTSFKGFNFHDRDSTSQVPSQSATHETYPRRSRPSFLDSLNIPRASSTSGLLQSQPQLVPEDVVESASQDHFGQNGNLESHLDHAHSKGNLIANSFQDQSLYVNHVERNVDLLPQKPNEDFAALEQHIEDLTQEKFSLQRALDASKTLAESLAAENSSLTESYNQQGGVVYQLKSEMESLQAEISALMAEHESIRMQSVNAQLECNAADERAKLLASEVIGLEEKTLRLRSNELKLEKELEKSKAEVASCKKKMLSLEKERQDLQMTIDALQEEKKLLQSKLRKASASGLFFDNDEWQSKKNVSTSTDDLEVHGGDAQLSPIPIPNEQDASSSSSSGADNVQLLQQNGASGLDGSTLIFSSDQMLMIQHINALLSELKAEKEELTQALVAEISTSSRLKDLNKDLSQRLEAQTQRLELLTAQSMAKENVAVRQPVDSQIVQENITYADEGDEVVERVLGWIMKLFPGGPSRRRTSKLI